MKIQNIQNIKSITDSFVGTPHYDSWLDTIWRNAVKSEASDIVSAISQAVGYPRIPKTKTIGKPGVAKGGRLQTMTKEQELDLRTRQVNVEFTDSESGATYAIVGAAWNKFIISYRSGGSNHPKINALKSAKSLVDIARVHNPKAKQANLRKFIMKDGRTAQVWEEELGLVKHPVYVKKH